MKFTNRFIESFFKLGKYLICFKELPNWLAVIHMSNK